LELRVKKKAAPEGGFEIEPNVAATD
jgi:hypothetical protein